MANLSQQEGPSESQGRGLAGLAVVLGMLTGFAGLVLAVMMWVKHDPSDAGYFLIASALAFGLLANAMFRK
jgi:hypothetical protein